MSLSKIQLETKQNNQNHLGKENNCKYNNQDNSAKKTLQP